jgi:hypothetical protein
VPYYLERPERRGDRARRKISTPSEAVEPTFSRGIVRVVCEKEATRALLIRRHGFAEVSSAPAPSAKEKPSASDVDPASLSYRERVALAKSLGVEGAHRMKSEALLAAILAAKA